MARDNLTFDDLLFIARRVGVEVVAAPSSHRGQLGKMGTVVGLTRHHTGTAETFKPTEDYPTYQVVKEGRPGLVNSLSAFGLGRHRAIYVFSEYISWHAGLWNWQGITDGNGHFLGIEAEGTGHWTDWQLDIYPRLCASILLFIGEGVDMMPRHLDGAMPRGRKSDAANLPADFTAKVANYLAHPEQIPVTAKPATSEEDDTVKFLAYRNDPAQKNPATGAAGNGGVVLAAPGIWYGVPSMAYFKLLQARGVCGDWINVAPNEFAYLRTVFMSSEVNDEEVKAALKDLTADQAAAAT